MSGCNGTHCQGCGKGDILGGVIAVAALFVTALAVAEYLWWVIAIVAVAGITRFTVIYRRAADKQAVTASYAAAFAREREAALAEQRKHELAVAAASAPRVHITNQIDPAALLAAALDLQQPDVIRGEVER